jgi:hypothetical protein
MNSTL